MPRSMRNETVISSFVVRRGRSCQPNELIQTPMKIRSENKTEVSPVNEYSLRGYSRSKDCRKRGSTQLL